MHKSTINQLMEMDDVKRSSKCKNELKTLTQTESLDQAMDF